MSDAFMMVASPSGRISLVPSYCLGDKNFPLEEPKYKRLSLLLNAILSLIFFISLLLPSWRLANALSNACGILTS